MNYTNLMITSTATGRILDNTQNLFLIKMLLKSRYERNLNIIKTAYNRLTVSIISNGEILKTS